MESEANKLQRINVAEGQGQAIEIVARATAQGIREVADAIGQPHGLESVQMRVAEQYVREFGNLAKVNNTMIIPSNLTDIAGTIATAMKVIKSD